ncbi:MAG: hypothetical protein JXR83_05150 [Deltaproteobacteria bacterium]|nr:hypothetical protein [Deltaproteobacteria bacterium]
MRRHRTGLDPRTQCWLLAALLFLAAGCADNCENPGPDDSGSGPTDGASGSDAAAAPDAGTADAATPDAGGTDTSGAACEIATGGTIIATATSGHIIGIAALYSRPDSNQKLLTYQVEQDTALGVAVFDGTAFGTAATLHAPAESLGFGGAVDTCMAGPSGRPIIAIDGADADGFRNYVAVGDGAGGYQQAVLVEDEPATSFTMAPSFVACSKEYDRAFVITPRYTGTMWVVSWDGTSLSAPQQIVATGWELENWYVPQFTAGGRAVMPYYVHDDTVTTRELRAIALTASGLSTSTLLMTENIANPIFPNTGLLYTAASPHADWGLILFTDVSNSYQVIKYNADAFSAAEPIDAARQAEARARAVFFPTVDKAFIYYQVRSGDFRGTFHNGTALSATATIGHRGDLTSFHDPFLRFLPSPFSEAGLVTWGGDDTGLNLVTVTGETFGAPVVVNNDPGYCTMFPQYAAGNGDPVLLVYDELTTQDDVAVYARTWTGGQLGPQVPMSCPESPDYGMGDFSVYSAGSDRFAVLNGYGGTLESGQTIRLFTGGTPVRGLVYQDAIVEIRPVGDKFLVVHSAGGVLAFDLL